MDGWPCPGSTPGGGTISVCNQPPRSTQPSTLHGTVKWVPAKGRWRSATGSKGRHGVICSCKLCDPCLSALEALCVKMRYTNRRILYYTLLYTEKNSEDWPNKQNDWLTESRFYIPPDTKQFILETFFPANLLTKYWKTKTNTTKQTCINCIRNKLYYNIK